MGVKYELDSWFKGGILYEGHGDPKDISDSEVTKSKVSFLTPTAEFTAKTGVGLMFGCDIIIDKLAGPEIAVGPKLKAQAGLTIAPFEKKKVDFNASVDFGIVGEVGAKIKVWKWELAEWHTDLDFGLNWNIFKYPKDNSNGDKDAEDYCNDNEVQKNVEQITKKLEKNAGKNALQKALDNWRKAWPTFEDQGLVTCVFTSIKASMFGSDLTSYYNKDPKLFEDITKMVAYENVLKCNRNLPDLDDVRNDIRKWYEAIQ